MENKEDYKEKAKIHNDIKERENIINNYILVIKKI